MVCSVLFWVFPFALLSGSEISGQTFPDKIRGYKVHDKVVTAGPGKSAVKIGDDFAAINLGDPEVINVTMDGMTIAIPAEIKPLGQSGKIDFLTFYDFQVNGIPVTVEEYRTPFILNKSQPTVLPQPAQIVLPITGIVNAAWKEMRDSKELWNVTGKIFVFGRFRKLGFHFKRAIPVEVEFRIKNPLRTR